ncbi:NAD-dependent succinate-semialdehyde dehydrogenase [Carboxylicivirga mesophila]|uniref:NAD-dependent succinate-semialdehyde dehydrogenase n=1 Tax=Carboxylicivirga mesophila TaxID=1166478 RepID=A0ABS5K4B7_9BACT|nr:NAD-dependent succinate-semialdehyde dehydrogenase [Carboxylicivirga mesophila]MBS2209802.1 NAD-dependent succinate-semialdehyde dehydrogenase [Carboxylicivirga mesophila]
MYLKSINPATGEIIREYEEFYSDEIDNAIAANYEAYKIWRKEPVELRAQLLIKAAKVLRDKQEGLAFNITVEMGKNIVEARAEVEKCAKVCEYYAQNGAGFLKSEIIPTEASLSYASMQAIGPVLAIMPWNFPLWQVFRFAAPALMAGNVCLLKHASNVPACALAIENIFVEAGFPADVFKTLLVRSSKVEKIISDKRVKAVTLTGSTPAGKAVASTAGQHLKKCVLELGGSDPYLILKDADIDAAVEACVAGRILNAGQSCIGAKRFIIADEVYDEFATKFTDKMRDITIGDPFDETKDMGPLAKSSFREDLHRQVESSIGKGAKLLTGGYIPNRDGAYYPATVLGDVQPGMVAYHEELFGPVASLIRAKDEADAIRIANDTVFGLGAAVFTRDVKRGQQIAEEELDAGCCFVNDFVRSDPRLPFGGVKESGYGRELSHYGMKEFMNIKGVYIK